MQSKTTREYLSLAQHFYEKRLGGQPPAPHRVRQALEACAGEYRPAYWRRLRGALALAQEAAGYPDAAALIRATRNPTTVPGSTAEVKPKQRRAKTISPADQERLRARLEERGDRAALAALEVVRLTGCRPAEIASVRVEGDRVRITGAKSRDDRGIAERVLQVEPLQAAWIQRAIAALREASPGGDVSAEVGRVQDRVARAGQVLWPRRAATPTLYSWRHQMGADLKAGGMGRREVAYVMGHRSTQSVNVYGDRRQASGGRGPRPAPEAELSLVVENHDEHMGKSAKRQKTQRVRPQRGFDGAGPGL